MPNGKDLNEIFEGLLRWAKEAAAQREWEDEHTYAIYLIEVLKPYPRGIKPAYVYPQMEKLFIKDKKQPVPTFEATIRSSYNAYCETSEVFRKSGKPISDAIFRSRERGVWGLVPDKAEEWLKKRLGSE